MKIIALAVAALMLSSPAWAQVPALPGGINVTNPATVTNAIKQSAGTASGVVTSNYLAYTAIPVFGGTGQQSIFHIQAGSSGLFTIITPRP